MSKLNIPSLSARIPGEIRNAFNAVKSWFADAEHNGGLVTGTTLNSRVNDLRNELVPMIEEIVPPSSTSAPDAVTGFQGTASTVLNLDGIPTNIVTLVWNTSVLATGYVIRYKVTTDTVYQYVSLLNRSATTTIIGGLNDDTDYHFSIKAVNEAGESGWIADITVTATHDTTAPDVPTVSGTQLVQGVKTVIARWGGVGTQDLNRYELQYGTAADFTGASSVFVQGTFASFPVTPTTTYYARVRSIDLTGNASSWLDLGSIATVKIDGATIIQAATVTADLISVTSLAAVSAAMGDLTSGTITLNAAGSHLKMGQTAYNTGIGLWVGNDGSGYKLSLGNPAAKYFRFNSVDGTMVTNCDIIMGAGSSITWDTVSWSGTPPATVANSNISISSSGVLSGGGGGTVTAVGINAVKTDASNAPSSLLNSSVSISSSGALSGAGGGQVTMSGLGYTGALNATANTVSQGTLAARPTGANGDFYYGTDTKVLYQKVSGSWVAGPAGTYLDSNGIYTGTLTATQVNAVAINADSISSGTLTGRTVQTTATASRGIKITTASLIAYNSGGTAVCTIDASTGALTATSATITGSIQTAASGERITIATDGGFTYQNATETLVQLGKNSYSDRWGWIGSTTSSNSRKGLVALAYSQNAIDASNASTTVAVINVGQGSYTAGDAGALSSGSGSLHGVAGYSSNASKAGLYGYNSSSGYGVQGVATSGPGGRFSSSTGKGIEITGSTVSTLTGGLTISGLLTANNGLTVSGTFSVGTGSKTDSAFSAGYQTLVGGIMIQWGQVSTSSNTTSFPTSFPTRCLHVFLQRGMGSGATVTSGNEMFVGAGATGWASPTTTGFTTPMASTVYPVSYLAIGF